MRSTSGLLMLLLVCFLVAIPVVADGVSLSNEGFSSTFTETKIAGWEEVGAAGAENVAALAVDTLPEAVSANVNDILQELSTHLADHYVFIGNRDTMARGAGGAALRGGKPPGF